MELLLAATLSCSDGRWILSGLADTTMGTALQSELIIEVIQAMPDDCDPSDYRPSAGESRRRSS